MIAKELLNIIGAILLMVVPCLFWLKKLKSLKASVKVWNKDVLSDVHNNVKMVNDNLNDIQQI